MVYCSAEDVSNYIGTKVFTSTSRPTVEFVELVIETVTKEINAYTANAFEPTLLEVAETRNAEQALIDMQGRMNIKLNHRNLLPFGGIGEVKVVNSGTGYTTVSLEVVGDCLDKASLEPILEEEFDPPIEEGGEPIPLGTYKIVGVKVLNYGEGYKEIPSITITGDGTDAELTTELDGTELKIVNGGVWKDYKLNNPYGYEKDWFIDTSAGILFLKRFPDIGMRHIKIRYKYGNYDSVPSDIKMAAILLTSAQIISQDDRAFLTVDGTHVTPTNQQKAEMWRKEAYNILRRRAEFNVII